MLVDAWELSVAFGPGVEAGERLADANCMNTAGRDTVMSFVTGLTSFRIIGIFELLTSFLEFILGAVTACLSGEPTLALGITSCLDFFIAVISVGLAIVTHVMIVADDLQQVDALVGELHGTGSEIFWCPSKVPCDSSSELETSRTFASPFPVLLVLGTIAVSTIRGLRQ